MIVMMMMMKMKTKTMTMTTTSWMIVDLAKKWGKEKTRVKVKTCGTA